MREQSISEMNENENPCWNGYEMVGMKMKDGKEVPNCVPKNESVNEIQYDDALAKFNKELENNSEIKKAAKHYKKSVQDVVKVLQSKIKVNRYSDKSIKQISINYTEDGPLSSKVTIKASQNYKQNESVNEGKYDGMLDVIEDLVSKAKSFMDVGNQLKKHKVKYSFSTSMIPMYKLDKLPIVIVNKKYVDKADREVGDIAIGLMESIKESVNEKINPKFYDARVQWIDPKYKKKFVGDVVRYDNGEYKVNLGKDGRFEKYILAKEKDLKIVSKSTKRTFESIDEGMMSLIDAIRQDSKDVRDFVSNVFKDSEFKKMKNDKDFIKYLKSIYEGVDESAKVKSLEEKINLFVEENVPTDPSKWSYYKSQAKKKFDVYPSAYANGWAAKKYKAAGGGWKKEK